MSVDEHQEKQVTLTEAEHHAILQAMGLKAAKKRKSLGSGAAEPAKKHKSAHDHDAPSDRKGPHPPSVNFNGEYTCLWCLRIFNHPPAWTVHSKTCAYNQPLWLKRDPTSSLPSAEMKKARLKLLKNSRMPVGALGQWRERVERVAMGKAPDSSSEEEDEQEEEGKSWKGRREQESAAVREQLELERKQRAEAAHARAQRAVKRLVGKLPTAPRQVTVQVVLTLYTAEEIRSILADQISEFAAEAAETTAAEEDGVQSLYRVDAEDDTEGENEKSRRMTEADVSLRNKTICAHVVDILESASSSADGLLRCGCSQEKMLLAKRLVGLLRMRLHMADPDGSDSDDSDESVESESETWAKGGGLAPAAGLAALAARRAVASGGEVTEDEQRRRREHRAEDVLTKTKKDVRSPPGAGAEAAGGDRPSAGTAAEVETETAAAAKAEGAEDSAPVATSAPDPAAAVRAEPAAAAVEAAGHEEAVAQLAARDAELSSAPGHEGAETVEGGGASAAAAAERETETAASAPMAIAGAAKAEGAARGGEAKHGIV